jgi:hypothetical protein
MARNGGVRYGLVFAVLLAFVSYTTGVSMHGSVAAELAAELAAAGTERDMTRDGVREGSLAQGKMAAEVAAEVAAGNVQREELRCDHGFARLVGRRKSYPKRTQNVTYCLTLGDSKCWRGKNAAKNMRYHYKGQTNDGRPLCPIAATWMEGVLVTEGSARKNTGFDPSLPFYNDKPSFDKVIINNHGVWRCKHASNSCWCRDEARDGGNAGGGMSEHTCRALMTKPFCERKSELPCFSVPADPGTGGRFEDECGFCADD